jgi:hypothetical protein
MRLPRSNSRPVGNRDKALDRFRRGLDVELHVASRAPATLLLLWRTCGQARGAFRIGQAASIERNDPLQRRRHDLPPTFEAASGFLCPVLVLIGSP